MGKNIYIYDSREFYSIKTLAEYVGINEKTLTARLRRGIPLEKACEKIDLRCVCFDDKGVQKSISQICREQSKDIDLIMNRRKYGYSLNDALNTPKKISKQGIPIVVNGVLYNSIASAISKMDLSHKESAIRRRLKLGVEPNAAFYFEK